MNIRAKIFGGVPLSEEPLIPGKKPKGAKADTLYSVPVTRESRQRRNSRGEDRHRLVGEHAKATHNGVSYDVELVNLSGGGAMIRGSFEPMLWDRVDLHLGDHGTIECAVRWLRDDQVGLEFAHETHLDWPSDQVATVLRHIIERTFPHIQFPESRQPAPAPAQVDRENEHRSAPRHPLIWKGTLHHDFQSTEVRLRNISETGAMIQTNAKVRVGSEPLLQIGDQISITARVQWAVGDQVGLKFHRPFDLSMLAESRPSVAVSACWTPPETLAMDLDDDDRWDRLSIAELRRELEGFLKR